MNINAKTVTSVSIVIELDSAERAAFDDLVWKLRNVILDSKREDNGCFMVRYTDKDNDARTYSISNEQSEMFGKLYAVI